MADQYFEDRRHSLSELVHSTLSRSPYLTGRNVRIEVVENDVVLSGVVQTYYQKQMAQETIRNMDGIGRVENRIEVVSV